MVALALPSTVFAGNPTTIIWDSFPTSESYGNPDFTIEATTDATPRSSDPGADRTWVNFSATGDCEIVAGSYRQYPDSGISTASIHITAAGSCAIYASANNDAGVVSATDSEDLPIGQATQRIDFPSPSPTISVGVGAQLSAYSVSLMQTPHPRTGFPLQFESLDPGVCSANDYWPTGYVFGISSGTCRVKASQDGDNNWSSTYTIETITVAKASQTISSTIPDVPAMPFNLSSYFSVDSGQQIQFSASGAYCTLQGNWVFPTQIALDNDFGTCYITASVPETSQYSATTLKVTFFTGGLGIGIRDRAVGDLATPGHPAANCHMSDGDYWCTHDWCGFYATTVWQREGVDIADMDDNVGGVSQFWNGYGRKNGYDALPAVGDVVVYVDGGGDFAHVAIVTKVNGDGTFESVGGNQGGHGDSDSVVSFNPVGFMPGTGYQVKGFVRPALPAGHATAPTDLTYSMQTGDTASGSLTVQSAVGTASRLNMLVGPFGSDVDLQLHRPDGSLISSSDPGVTFTKSANSIQVSIINAEPGVWQYQIHANQLDGNGENIRVWASSVAVPTTIVTQDSDTTQYPQPVTFNASVMSPVAGGATPTGSVQFEVDGSPAGDPIALDAAGQATWTATRLSGGSHTVSIDYLGSSQFVAPSSAPITHIVTKADQTITFGPLAGKTYGDADFSVGATASSGLTVSFAAASNCTVSGTAVHISGAGSCTITASQVGDRNYNPAPDVAQSFSIAKKPMTITANDATKLYGHTLTFAGTEFSVVGLVPGDSVTSVTLTSAGQSAGAQPGHYGIVPSAALGNRLSNYVITYANGTLTVNLVAIVGLDSVSISGSEMFDAVPNGGVFVVSNGSITVTGSAAIRGDLRSTQGSVGMTGSTVVTGDVSAGTTIASVSRIHGLASPNSPVPALIAPTVAACSPYSSAAGLSGSYSYDPATGNLSVSGSKTLTIASGSYCFASITLSGSAKLVVSGPVTISLTGKFSVTGSATINATGNAANLQISSSYAGSNGVAISGSPVAHLTMYAPAAQVVISGSAEIAGLVLGKSVSVSGSAAIHQDSSAVTVWAGFYRN